MAIVTFNEERHEYTWNDEVVPSVSELIKRAGMGADYSSVPAAVLDKARRRGCAVHDFTAELDKGNSPDSLMAEEDVAFQVAKMVVAYNQFKEDYKVTVLSVEQRVAYQMNEDERPLYAGTLDRVVMIDGVEYTLDIKCTSKMPETVGVQTCLYDIARRGKGNLMALRLDKDGKYHLWKGTTASVFAAASSLIHQEIWFRSSAREKKGMTRVRKRQPLT